MCKPVCDAAEIHNARGALRRLQSAVAKHNASIRVRYPPSRAVRKTVENTLSGTINDMPFSVQIFARSGEDAACLCNASLGCDPLDIFTEGMADLIDEARVWAGRPAMTDTAVTIYPKAISMVEEHLFTEIAGCARKFFAAVYAIPSVETGPLPTAERVFWSRYKRAEATLARATKDNSAAVRATLLLTSRLPASVADRVVSYLS